MILRVRATGASGASMSAGLGPLAKATSRRTPTTMLVRCLGILPVARSDSVKGGV